MATPSKDWSGLSGISPGSDKYEKIHHILSSANFEHLKQRALASRRMHQTSLPPDVSCSLNLTQFTSGYDNVVVEVAFSDGIFWVARIPYRTIDDKTKTLLLSEIATINIIRRCTSIPVPRVFAFEMSADQPFGFPYVLMECLHGRRLDDGIAQAIPPQHHPKVAKQLASVFNELQNLTFDRIGRLWCGEAADEPVQIIPMAWHETPGPLETSLEYFYNQQQGANREITAAHPNEPEWNTACWMLKAALAYIVVEDRVRGPFPLCHLDLHFGNMLFDSDYNLTGIIDWSNAQAAPIEQLSVCPEFVIFPGLSEEQNRPIVELRKLVIQSIKEMENDKKASTASDQQRVKLEEKLNYTTLSTYMASRSAEITHRWYMASPGGSLFAGRRVAKLIFGEHVTWEQLKKVYGALPVL